MAACAVETFQNKFVDARRHCFHDHFEQVRSRYAQRWQSLECGKTDTETAFWLYIVDTDYLVISYVL